MIDYEYPPEKKDKKTIQKLIKDALLTFFLFKKANIPLIHNNVYSFRFRRRYVTHQKKKYIRQLLYFFYSSIFSHHSQKIVSEHFFFSRTILHTRPIELDHY